MLIKAHEAATNPYEDTSVASHRTPSLSIAGKSRALRRTYLYKTLLCPFGCKRGPPLPGRAFADRNCHRYTSEVSGLGAMQQQS